MGKVHNALEFIDNKYSYIQSTCNEKRKIHDSRRKKILNQVQLSDKQKAEIDDLYLSSYGKKIPYCWHRYYTSYTGLFDPKYIPELIFIPKIEAYMVPRSYAECFSDKNNLPLLINGEGISNVRPAKIYLSCTGGIYRENNSLIVDRETATEIISNIGEAFIKPSKDSNSGKGCFPINMDKGVDLFSGKNSKDIILQAGKDFNVQELVVNSKELRTLHDSSINTFRVITYILKDKVFHAPAILRIGRNGNRCDNAHQGGMFVGIDDGGYLLECAYTEFQERFHTHPNSGIRFNGFHIPNFERVLNAVHMLHQKIPQIRMISWDATINDRDEIVIIEMNLIGQSVWMSQMAHGKGFFGDNTEEILKLISGR